MKTKDIYIWQVTLTVELRKTELFPVVPSVHPEEIEIRSPQIIIIIRLIKKFPRFLNFHVKSDNSADL